MGFSFEVVNITEYPLTTGLLCAICIVKISKDFSNLAPLFELWSEAEFLRIFYFTHKIS